MDVSFTQSLWKPALINKLKRLLRNKILINFVEECKNATYLEFPLQILL